MLRIGVDEAGLGPTLGPLVVAGAAFRLGGDAPYESPFSADLAARLAEALAPPGRRRGARLVVGDSKAVYGPSHDLAALEVPVLAFAAAAAGAEGRLPATLDDLLAALGADPGERTRHAWYAGPGPSLPLRADREHVLRAAASLRDALSTAAVDFVGFAADVVPEARLNASFVRTPNKADVLFSRTADVVDRLLASRASGEPAGVAVDRHGGRRLYIGPLSARWPRRFAWALDETPTLSRYRVDLGDAESEFRFVVGGDAAHVEIGLASMAAKYLRELFMELWNGYFSGICPGVDRTAGYATDARRWLEGSRAARLAAGIPDEMLVRTR